MLDRRHRRRLNELDMVLPDGQPVRWALNLLFHTALTDRVYGPNLMLRLCERAQAMGFSVGLYGNRPDVLEDLRANLLARFPALRLAALTPSRFGRVSREEQGAIARQIAASNTDLLFVSLGCPRQEIWLYENRPLLSMPMVAVGAAFDFHAKRLAQAPQWMQDRGLEWLYRLRQEPRRLWWRYAVLNPVFLGLLALQLLGLRQPRGKDEGGAIRMKDMHEISVKIGLVVGASQEVHCGVRDYTERLAEALRGIGIDAKVLAPENWGLRDGLAFIRALRAERPDIVHLQYPSIGHRRSLLPHGLGCAGIARRSLVTLHEHSALPRVQRAANALFRATFDRMIFPTVFEARRFGAPAVVPVIPIGSNVPVHPGKPPRDDRVLYFGQIRPAKGIEVFIELARRSAAAGEPTRFQVIGSAPPRWMGYLRALQAAAPATIEWVLDARFADVGEAMATARAAYLPFPDGASLRRGTLIAALANGLPVVARPGPATPDSLRAVSYRQRPRMMRSAISPGCVVRQSWCSK